MPAARETYQPWTGIEGPAAAGLENERASAEAPLAAAGVGEQQRVGVQRALAPKLARQTPPWPRAFAGGPTPPRLAPPAVGSWAAPSPASALRSQAGRGESVGAGGVSEVSGKGALADPLPFGRPFPAKGAALPCLGRLSPRTEVAD